MSLLNRVAVLCATAGQGTITLGAAIGNDFLTEVEAGAADGWPYVILIREGADCEIVQGVYNASGRTFTRDSVKNSKIAGVAGTTKMTLAGNAVVRFVMDAATFNNAAIDLSDGATVALDAGMGNLFDLTAAGNRQISAPSHPTDGQRIVIRHKASGADRTLSLASGAGGFRFGTDITALTATTSAKTDHIGAIYNAADDRWDVVAVVKGF